MSNANNKQILLKDALVIVLLLCQLAALMVESAEIVSRKATNEAASTFVREKKNRDKNHNAVHKQQNFAKNLYNIKDIGDLNKLGIDLNEKPRTGEIMGRSSNGNSMLPAALRMRDEVKDAVPGKCDPKPVCITNPLVLNITSTNQHAFPPCINIHRCDGLSKCCPNDEKCVVVKTSEVKLSKVYLINFNVDDKSTYEESFISVQNHTECQCKCQYETDDDCKQLNPNFIKSENSCECVCPEYLSCGPFHEFDEKTCGCVCNRHIYGKPEQTCKQRGLHWNESACRCESKPRSY